MSFQDDCVTSWIQQLRGEGKKAFATTYWDHLQGRGPQPDSRQFGISYKDAQSIVINLASRK